MIVRSCLTCHCPPSNCRHAKDIVDLCAHPDRTWAKVARVVGQDCDRWLAAPTEKSAGELKGLAEVRV